MTIPASDPWHKKEPIQGMPGALRLRDWRAQGPRVDPITTVKKVNVMIPGNTLQ